MSMAGCLAFFLSMAAKLPRAKAKTNASFRVVVAAAQGIDSYQPVTEARLLNPDDRTFERDGVTAVVDEVSLEPETRALIRAVEVLRPARTSRSSLPSAA